MKIGSITFDNPLFLAPMCDYSRASYRLICKRCGCGGLVTEMIAAIGLIYNAKNTRRRLVKHAEEGPLGFQLFSYNPDHMAEAARIAQEQGAHFVDINMGCPAKKVVGSGNGAALMRQPLLAAQIFSRMRAQLTIPLTVKIRSGWDDDERNFLEIGRIAQEEGLDCVFFHARTRAQQYHGRADWQEIKILKQELTIPVVGNGDVTTPEEALAMLSTTGCDGVMIGRGALGNPWLFANTLQLMNEGSAGTRPTIQDRKQTSIDHFELLLAELPEEFAVKEIRKHLIGYTKGLRGALWLRTQIPTIISRAVYLDLVERFFEPLLEQDAGR